MNDYDAKFRIGDITSTINEEISDNWLLCNGDAIDKNKYPELYNKTKNEFLTGRWKKLPLSFGYFIGLSINKNYIIILEQKIYSNNYNDSYYEKPQSEIKMFYSTNISENFYECPNLLCHDDNIKIMNSDDLFLIFSIIKKDSSKNNAFLFNYAANPLDILNTSYLELEDENYNINYYGFINNLFFICINTYKSSHILYSSYPKEWKKIKFYDNKSIAIITSILYVNNKYIFFGIKRGKNEQEYHIWEFENLESINYSKSTKINFGFESYSYYPFNLFYKNGNYILSNGYHSKNGYLGPWIKPNNNMNLNFLNNLFLNFVNDNLYYGDTIEEIDKNKIKTNLISPIKNTYFGTNYFFVVEESNQNIWYIKYGKCLPKINLATGVNTFIKAK